MKILRNLAPLVAISAFCIISTSPVAAITNDLPDEAKPQVEHGIVLPVWQPDECQGNFDIRIWPEELVIWLERENLKEMVKDPNISEKERASLKRILMLQTALASRD